MPHQNNRSTGAIAQQAQGKNNFISPQCLDSASDGAPSSGELSLSPDEDKNVVYKLYNIPKSTTKKQKSKLSPVEMLWGFMKYSKSLLFD